MSSLQLKICSPMDDRPRIDPEWRSFSWSLWLLSSTLPGLGILYAFPWQTPMAYEIFWVLMSWWHDCKIMERLNRQVLLVSIVLYAAPPNKHFSINLVRRSVAIVIWHRTNHCILHSERGEIRWMDTLHLQCWTITERSFRVQISPLFPFFVFWWNGIFVFLYSCTCILYWYS
jgi:hypothetical protein